MWHPLEAGLAGGSKATEAARRLIARWAPTYQVGLIETGGADRSGGATATWVEDGRTVRFETGEPDPAWLRAIVEGCDWVLVVGDVATDRAHVRLTGSADGSPRGPMIAEADPGDLERLSEIVLGHLESQARRAPLFGLVLAGGRSVRMGRDKALLRYQGRIQLARAADALAPHCDQVFVSCRMEQGDQDGFGGFAQIHDRFLEAGPIGGILSAMARHPEAAWLVAACDLPFLGPDTVADLVRQRDPLRMATAYRSTSDGLPEPLCAVYEPRARGRLLAALAGPKACPRKVLIRSRPNLVDLADPRALANVNDPDAYHAIVQEDAR